MKAQTLLNFVLFLCLLAVGYSLSTRIYRVGAALDPDSGELVTVNVLKTTQSLNNGQRTILLVGVDSLDTSPPQLTSLWVVSSLPSDLNLRMFPIFPSGKETLSDFETSLRQTFKLERINGKLVLGQDFIGLLSDSNYWWSGYFIFDQVAQLETIDLLGGIEINGEMISGSQLINELPNLEENPRDAFWTELTIVQTACQNLLGVIQNPDWLRLESMAPAHILTDLDIQLYLTELAASVPSQRGLNCRFPTLEISRTDN